MIKLDKICEKLEDIRNRLEEKIEDIYCRADDKGRELTNREQERIDEMESEMNDIDGALDYLKEYCENF